MKDEPTEPLFGDEPLTEKKLLEWGWQSLDDAKAFYSKRWEEAGKLWNLYAGSAMSDADKSWIEKTKQIDTELAMAQAGINAVWGAELAQRNEPIFAPQDLGTSDAVQADWATQLVRQALVHCSGHREMGEAYLDTLIGGYGFIRGYVDVERRPVRPKIEYVDFWRVWPDASAKKPNLLDGNHWIIEDEMLLDDALARWPDKGEALREAAGKEGGGTGSVRTPTPTAVRGPVEGGGKRKSKRKTVTVYEFQYAARHARVSFIDPKTGEFRDEPSEAFEEYRAQLAEEYEVAFGAWQMAMDPSLQPPEPVLLDEETVDRYPGRCYYRTFFIEGGGENGTCLEYPPKRIAADQFTVKACTGFPWKDPDADSVKYVGMARFLFDVVAWLNKAFRDYLDIMGRVAKGGGRIGEGALPEGMSLETFLANYAKNGNWMLVTDQAIVQDLIKPWEIPNIPPQIQNIFNMCVDLLGRLGVNEWIDATGTGDRSNSFVSNLQEQGLQRMLPIREPRTAMIVEVGKLLAALLVRHLPARELDRMLGEQEPFEGVTHEKDQATGEMVPKREIDPLTQKETVVTPGHLLKKADLLAYEVTASVGAATPSQKYAVSMWFSQHGMGDQLAKMGVQGRRLAPYIIRNSPGPGAEQETLAALVEEDFAQAEKLSTTQGILEFVAAMPLAEKAQFLQQLETTLVPAEPPAGQP